MTAGRSEPSPRCRSTNDKRSRLRADRCHERNDREPRYSMPDDSPPMPTAVAALKRAVVGDVISTAVVLTISVRPRTLTQGDDVPKTIVDVEALYSALNDKRERQGISWRELASELELSPSTFTRMAQGQRPDIDTFTTLLQWLRMPADKYTRVEGERPRRSSTKDEPLVEITTLLRSSKSIKRDQAEALNSIITAAFKSIVKD